MVELDHSISRSKRATLLSAGEVARRSGVAVSTLHFYEIEGLISSMRSKGNQRRYWRGTLRRIAVIQLAQRIGLSLAEIREAMMSLPDGAKPKAADWERLSRKWRKVLDLRLVELLALRDQLGGCIGCGCLSLAECPLRNPDDILAESGHGPRLIRYASSTGAVNAGISC